jgi:ParB-like chromosome segregation protein Spo0J
MMQTAVQSEIGQPMTPEEEEWMADKSEFDPSKGPANCVFKWVPLADLSKHPLNIEIYGDTPDPKFVESVRRHGIITPLIAVMVAGCLRILSGHKRWQAASILGIRMIPVWVHEGELTELEQRRELLAANEQRQMDNLQRARHYKATLAVEKELSAQNKVASGGNHQKAVTENFRNRSGGRAPTAKESAAASVGWSPGTADQAVNVVEVAEAAAAAGDTDRASALTKLLNKGPVAKAHRAATGKEQGNGKPKRALGTDKTGHPIPERLTEIFESWKEFNRANDKKKSLKGDVRKLAKTAGGVLIDLQSFETYLDTAARSFFLAMPYAVCRKCNGDGCRECLKRGWLPQRDFPGSATKEAADP